MFMKPRSQHSTCSNLDHWTLHTLSQALRNPKLQTLSTCNKQVRPGLHVGPKPFFVCNVKFRSSMWDVHVVLSLIFLILCNFVDLIHRVSHRRWHKCRCRSCKRSWGNRWMHGKRQKWTLGWQSQAIFSWKDALRFSRPDWICVFDDVIQDSLKSYVERELLCFELTSFFLQRWFLRRSWNLWRIIGGNWRRQNACRTMSKCLCHYVWSDLSEFIKFESMQIL